MSSMNTRAVCRAIGMAMAASTLSVPLSALADGTAAEGVLEEIVVTAQRREDTLQKTALAIVVVSADQLRDGGIVQLRDLGNAVPGLVVGQGGATSQIYVRGVGDFGSTPITNPAVATNVDGVYVASSQAAGGNMFDLARVEVLKGPQGTLYGRNASGGAINIISARPTFNGYSGYGDVEFGNYASKSFEGALNVPLSEQFAMRFSGKVVDRNGYSSEGRDDDKHQAARLQALWRSDTVSMLVAGEYSHMGGNGAGWVGIGPVVNNLPARTSSDSQLLAPRFYAYAAAQGYCIPGGFFPGYTTVGNCPSVAPYPTPPFPSGTVGPYVSLLKLITQPPTQDNTHWAVRAELTADFGATTLTVIPAHRHSEVNFNEYPNFLYSLDSTTNVNSLEARLSQNSAALKWVAGLYYYDEKQDSTESIIPGLMQNNSPITQQKTRSVAGFGELTFSITNATRLIAGVRYTSDNKQINGVLIATPPAITFLPTSATGARCFAGLPNPCQIESFTGDKDFNKLTWKAGVEHDLSPRSMLFATVSTGFKAGGFNQSVDVGQTTTASSFSPETLTAFEFGSRNRFLGDTLQVNAELFYWQYKNHQEPHVLIDGAGNVAFSYANAGDAKAEGGNIDVIWQPSKADRVHFGVEYLHSRYDSFSFDVPANPAGGTFVRGYGNGFTSDDPTSPLVRTTGCKPSAITSGLLAGGYHVDCSGFQLAHAPEWVGSGGYSHIFSISNGGDVTAAVNAQFSSAKWLAIDFIPSERAPSYVTVDANLAYHAPSGNWSIAAFGRNLTDKEVYASAIEHPFIAGLVAASVGAPRTYGVRLSAKF